MAEKGPEAHVQVVIGRPELMRALRALTINHPDFPWESWSIFDAESMEAAARLIRDGHERPRPEPTPSLHARLRAFTDGMRLVAGSANHGHSPETVSVLGKLIEGLENLMKGGE